MKIEELKIPQGLKITDSGKFSEFKKYKRIKKFDYSGVYIMCDSDDNIVYIGSAYNRFIIKRIKQYLTNSKTGNSLANNIAEVDGCELDKAKEKIKDFKIYTISYEDLESELIRIASPKYNKNGTDKK